MPCTATVILLAWTYSRVLLPHLETWHAVFRITTTPAYYLACLFLVAAHVKCLLAFYYTSVLWLKESESFQGPCPWQCETTRNRRALVFYLRIALLRSFVVWFHKVVCIQNYLLCRLEGTRHAVPPSMRLKGHFSKVIDEKFWNAPFYYLFSFCGCAWYIPAVEMSSVNQPRHANWSTFSIRFAWHLALWIRCFPEVYSRPRFGSFIFL